MKIDGVLRIRGRLRPGGVHTLTCHKASLSPVSLSLRKLEFSPVLSEGDIG